MRKFKPSLYLGGVGLALGLVIILAALALRTSALPASHGQPAVSKPAVRGASALAALTYGTNTAYSKNPSVSGTDANSDSQNSTGQSGASAGNETARPGANSSTPVQPDTGSGNTVTQTSSSPPLTATTPPPAPSNEDPLYAIDPPGGCKLGGGCMYCTGGGPPKAGVSDGTCAQKL